MKLVNQYRIPFTGLKEGEHEFTFGFGEKFFNNYEVLDARTGKIEALVLLEKKSNMLTLNIQLRGILDLQCDRCLDTFSYPIAYSGSLIVKFGFNEEESTDEIWVVNPNEYELDLEQYFFECISLSLPIQRIHPDDLSGKSGCNSEMLNILNTHKISSTGEKKENDPRWDKLKDLLNNT